MNMASQVLIPIDFSGQSLIALDQSHNLAKFYNAELTLLHVIDSGHMFSIFSKRDSEDEALKNEAKKKLEELGAEITKKYEIKANIIVTKGRANNKIVEAANEISAKLIIMGVHNVGQDMKTRFVGSTVAKVVREAKCPVITIKGKTLREGCKNIVIPIDLTKESREKVDYAIELGKLYGATIHTISTLYTVDEDAAKRLVKHVKQVKKTIKAAGVNCTIEIVSLVRGNETIESAIINYAKFMEADLLMIMTQQEGEMKPFFVGSTAQNIINGSEIPVMSIVPSYRHSEAVYAN
jgi:nucleotide-binding universal stress UspA family protein